MQSKLHNHNGDGGFTFQYNSDFINNAAAVDIFEKKFEDWRCETDVNMILGDVTSANTNVADGTNSIRFGSLTLGVLGLVRTHFTNLCWANNFPSLNVTEIDISFNTDLPVQLGTQLTWYFGSGNPGPFEIDFESVVSHELGHVLQLGHVIDPNRIMHYSFGAGQVNRIIDSGSIDGAIDVHSRSTGYPGYCGNTPMTDYDNHAYVDSSAIGLGNGETWNNAFTSLQDAMKHKQCVETILVAEGNYYPDEGLTELNDDQNSSFVIDKALTIIGGYPAGGGAPDHLSHRTFLSGDLNQNGAYDGLVDSYTVLTIYDDAVLNGLSIGRGFASGQTDLTGKGGGVFQEGNAEYTNCTIFENISILPEGGGIYHKSGSATHNNTIFDSNLSYNFIPPVLYLPGLAGGLFVNSGNVILNGCTFLNDSFSENDLYGRNSATITIIDFLNIEE